MSDVAVAPGPALAAVRCGGEALDGGQLWVCKTRTLEPYTVYKDSALTVPWPTPIVLDNEGLIHRPIYQPTDSLVRYMLVAPDGQTVLWTADDVPSTVGSVVSINQWQTFIPTWLNYGTPNQLNSGKLFGRFRYTGLTAIEFTIRLDFAFDTVSGDGVWGFGNLPGTTQDYVSSYPIHAVKLAAPGVGPYAGIAIFQGPHLIIPFDGLDVSHAFSATRPFTWTNGDLMRVSGSYRSTPPPSTVVFQGPAFVTGWGTGPQE